MHRNTAMSGTDSPEAPLGRTKRLDIWVVVPAYRAAETIVRVVTKALDYADHVIVVDDACPNCTGEVARAEFDGNPRVQVVTHERNQGVGGATKTGVAAAIAAGAGAVVKLDADDQMDPSYIPYMIELLERHPYVGVVKGNRFASALVLKRMPRLRLIGNSGLSFLVKACSGYWNVMDPTNGYIVARADVLSDLNLHTLADRYFFEIDLLCALGLRRIPVAELEMDAIYGDENSSLSLSHAFFSFPGALLTRYLRRLFVQYVLTDINVGTLYAAAGVPLFLIGLAFGAFEWLVSSQTHVPRTSGTVILALLLFIVGFQLLLQAIAFDVAAATRTLKARVLRDTLDVSQNQSHAAIVDAPF